MSFFHDLGSRLYVLFFAPSRLSPPVDPASASDANRRSFKTLVRHLFLHLLWVAPVTTFAIWLTNELFDPYCTLDQREIYFQAALLMSSSILFGLLQRASSVMTCLGSAAVALAFAISKANSANSANSEILGFALTLVLVAFFFAAVLGKQSFSYFGLLLSVSISIPVSLIFNFSFSLWVFVVFVTIVYRLPVYLGEVIWAARCEFRMRAEPALTPLWWRQHPIRWDETIALPLPRSREFLTELLRFDPAFGFECVEFIISNRPVHAVAARSALTDATIDTMEVQRWDEIAALPKRLQWLGENQTAAPAELGGFLPRFVRIAEFVRQGLNLQSNYQKTKALSGAIKEADDLRAALVVAPSNVHPRLLTVAKIWRKHLAAALERLEATCKAKREIPSVFRFGVPLGEDAARLFVGRADVVRDLERLLLSDARPPSVLLYGARRMGKTSVLHQLPVRAGPRVAACFLDCQNPACRESAAQFFATLSANLVMSLKKRDVVILPLPADSLRQETFGSFDTWLRDVEAHLPADLRVFLCFDEYEGLDKTIAAGWGEQLLEYLRHLQQHRRRFLIIFSGVRAFHQLGPLWNRHFVSARLTHLTFIPAADMERLLREPCEDFNMHYDEGVVEQLLSLTHGQPFLTQALALELVEVLNSENRHMASLADLQRARQNLFASAKEFFNDIWFDAGDEGRKYLHALALGQPASAPPEVIEHLNRMDVLDADGNISVPLVAAWLASPEPKK